MIEIETKQDTFESSDSFKLTGTIKFTGALAVISSEGSRKSEAVEKAIEQIDELVKFLNDSKKNIGAI